MLSSSDKSLFLTKTATVNYVGSFKKEIECVVNVIVVFVYDRESKTVKVFVRNLDKKETKRLFEEIKGVDIVSGYDMQQFATEYYENNWEEIKIFA